MTSDQEGAILFHQMISTLVKIQMWPNARKECHRLLKEAQQEVTQGEGRDGFDRMMEDTIGVICLHLEHMADAKGHKDLPIGPTVLADLKAYTILQRKVSHGCTDASCSECDN